MFSVFRARSVFRNPGSGPQPRGSWPNHQHLERNNVALLPPFCSTYAGAKAAVEAFSEVLAAELAPEGP